MTLEEELRKEWHEAQYPGTLESITISGYIKASENWWLSKIQTILQERADAIRGKKEIEHIHEKDCKNFNDCEMFTRHTRSHNQALETAALLVEEAISSKKD